MKFHRMDDDDDDTRRHRRRHANSAAASSSSAFRAHRHGGGPPFCSSCCFSHTSTTTSTTSDGSAETLARPVMLLLLLMMVMMLVAVLMLAPGVTMSVTTTPAATTTATRSTIIAATSTLSTLATTMVSASSSSSRSVFQSIITMAAATAAPTSASLLGISSSMPPVPMTAPTGGGASLLASGSPTQGKAYYAGLPIVIGIPYSGDNSFGYYTALRMADGIRAAFVDVNEPNPLWSSYGYGASNGGRTLFFNQTTGVELPLTILNSATNLPLTGTDTRGGLPIFNATSGRLEMRQVTFAYINIPYRAPASVTESRIRSYLAASAANPPQLLAAAFGALADSVITAANALKIPAVGMMPLVRAPYLPYRNTIVRDDGSAAMTAKLEELRRYAVTVCPSPDAEISALLNRLLIHHKVRRIVLITTIGFYDGAEFRATIAATLKQFDLELLDHIDANDTWTKSGSNLSHIPVEIAQNLTNRGVQAILNFGSIVGAAVEVIKQLVQRVGPEIIIAEPFVALFRSIDYNTEANTTKPAIYPHRGNVFVTLPGENPYTATDSAFLKDYIAARSRAVRTSFLFPFNSKDEWASFVMSGYATGSIIRQVLQTIAPGPVNAHTIHRELFGDRMFRGPTSFASGPFSGPCTTNQTTNCGCSSGARFVHIAGYNGTERYAIPEASYGISSSDCSPQGVSIQAPLVQLVAAPNASMGGLPAANGTEVLAALATASEEFVAGDRAGYYVNSSAGAATVAASTTARTGILVRLNYNVSDPDAITSIQRDRLLTVATGSAYAAREAVGGTSGAANVTAVVDPLQGVPAAHGGAFSARVVHLCATLEQEVHALTQAHRSRAAVAVVAGSGDAAATAGLVEAVRRSAHTFGREPGPVVVAASVAAGLAAAPVAAGTTLLVHGIAGDADVAAIAAYLARAGAGADVLVLLPFLHVRVWYTQLLAHVTAPGDRARVEFATALPSWNPVAAANTSALLKAYHAGLAGEGASRVPTPQSLLGLVTQRFLAALADRNPVALSERVLLRTLYEVSIVVVDTLVFGPFSNETCTDGASTCEINVGPRAVNVFTLDAVTTSAPSAAGAVYVKSFRFSVPEYQLLPPLPVADRTLTYALGGGAGALILLAVVFVVILLKTMRNTMAAPKDRDKPFTIVFTDIQSSTALWAEAPDAMAQAIEHHHALIRRLIVKHGGYEVKTIGDAFMIAFRHADAAVRLARDLQHDFYSSDAFPDAIDGAYLAFDQERLLLEGGGRTVNPDLINLSINLPQDVYARLWHGLRVRVGIHTGFGDIQKDPVTGGYDYYGTVVNTAARVEAVGHGGQILVTEAVLEALKEMQVSFFEEQAEVDEALAMAGLHPTLGPGGKMKKVATGRAPPNHVSHDDDPYQDDDGDHIDGAAATHTNSGGDLMPAPAAVTEGFGSRRRTLVPPPPGGGSEGSPRRSSSSPVELNALLGATAASSTAPSVHPLDEDDLIGLRLGAVALRGLTDRIMLIQIEGCKIPCGRRFPAMRFDKAGVADAIDEMSASASRPTSAALMLYGGNGGGGGGSGRGSGVFDNANGYNGSLATNDDFGFLTSLGLTPRGVAGGGWSVTTPPNDGRGGGGGGGGLTPTCNSLVTSQQYLHPFNNNNNHNGGEFMDPLSSSVVAYGGAPSLSLGGTSQGAVLSGRESWQHGPTTTPGGGWVTARSGSSQNNNNNNTTNSKQHLSTSITCIQDFVQSASFSQSSVSLGAHSSLQQHSQGQQGQQRHHSSTSGGGNSAGGDDDTNDDGLDNISDERRVSGRAGAGPRHCRTRSGGGENAVVCSVAGTPTFAANGGSNAGAGGAYFSHANGTAVHGQPVPAPAQQRRGSLLSQQQQQQLQQHHHHNKQNNAHNNNLTATTNPNAPIGSHVRCSISTNDTSYGGASAAAMGPGPLFLSAAGGAGNNIIYNQNQNNNTNKRDSNSNSNGSSHHPNGGPHNQQQNHQQMTLEKILAASAVSPQQTMAVLMAAFAVLPGPARRKELKALCDRWHLQVDTSAAAAAAAAASNANNSGSDKSHSGSTNATNGSGHGTAKVAAGLSRGDVAAAAMLEPLGRRLAGIAQRALQQQLLGGTAAAAMLLRAAAGAGGQQQHPYQQLQQQQNQQGGGGGGDGGRQKDRRPPKAPAATGTQQQQQPTQQQQPSQPSPPRSSSQPLVELMGTNSDVEREQTTHEPTTAATTTTATTVGGGAGGAEVTTAAAAVEVTAATPQPRALLDVSANVNGNALDEVREFGLSHATTTTASSHTATQ